MKKILNSILFLFSKIIYRLKGKRIYFNEWRFIKGGGKIGKDCEIYPSVIFGSEPYLIEIGNNVRLTQSVKFVTHDGGLWVLRNLHVDMKDSDKFGKIVVEDNVHIGWDTIIMPGVKIGKNSIIGCGSVVTKSIPANSVAVGVPAKVIESIDEYYEKNKDKVIYTKNLSSKDKKKYLDKIYNR